MAAGGRPLTIDVRRAGAEYRLLLSGEFDLQGAATFRGELDEALWARPERLVIDLSRLRFMDAAGLHEMVRTWDVARGGAGRGLKTRRPTPGRGSREDPGHR